MARPDRMGVLVTAARSGRKLFPGNPFAARRPSRVTDWITPSNGVLSDKTERTMLQLSQEVLDYCNRRLEQAAIPKGDADRAERNAEGSEEPVGSAELRPLARWNMTTVLSREECRRMLEWLDERNRLMGALMCGAGLRLLELVRLSVHDVDLPRPQVSVRSGKGVKGAPPNAAVRCARLFCTTSWHHSA